MFSIPIYATFTTVLLYLHNISRMQHFPLMLSDLQTTHNVKTSSFVPTVLGTMRTCALSINEGSSGSAAGVAHRQGSLGDSLLLHLPLTYIA